MAGPGRGAGLVEAGRGPGRADAALGGGPEVSWGAGGRRSRRRRGGGGLRAYPGRGAGWVEAGRGPGRADAALGGRGLRAWDAEALAAGGNLVANPGWETCGWEGRAAGGPAKNQPVGVWLLVV